jgi:tetratricopeptide (TPR) repeat protein
MNCFPRTTHLHGRVGTWVVACLLVVIALRAPLIAQGPSPDSAGTATLQGTVRDSHGRPVAAATVYVQASAGAQVRTAHTDAGGIYRFSALGEGTYSVRAEMAGFGEGASPSFVLASKEAKSIDLALAPRQAPQPPTSAVGTSAGAPEFFDEPKFTVAGVTDNTNSGGHGSNAALRTTESLAKDTVSLGRESPGTSQPALTSAVDPTETSLREAAGQQPGNFQANYRMGKLLLDEGKATEALPYLEQASRVNPGDYENAYQRVRAYAGTGQYERARTHAKDLLAGQDHAELHHLLADIGEKLGEPLEAVREYQRAAEVDPSEPNLFDWGAELLRHSALEPAIEVFNKGNHRFPQSVRMLVGLGVAWYARGSYDQAAQCLFQASDLNPRDTSPYLFLGKMQSVATGRPEGFVERLGRFATLQPENALANYYYAMSLRRQVGDDARELAPVESLLKKAVNLDPKLGAGYLQLGILYSDRGDLPAALAAYQKAIEASPELAEAHYRLGQAYRLSGERVRAQTELQLYDQMSKKTAEETERERRELQQFVYRLQGPTSDRQPQ